MPPSFRFLFAAIMLSTSILVFGLGAAALLLAMLRVDPVPVEQKAPDDAPSVAAPVEPAASALVAVEPETIAALGPELSPQPESAQPEIPVPESPAPSEITLPQADAIAGETKLAPT